MAGRSAVACLLVLGLAVSSSAAESIGVVLRTQHAQVRSTGLTPGTNILAGDTISVGPGGSVTLSLPDLGTLHIPESSRVQFSRVAGETRVAVVAGKAVFCASADEASPAAAKDQVTHGVGSTATLSGADPQRAERKVQSATRTVHLERGQCAEITLSDKAPAAASTAALKGRTIVLIGGAAAVALLLWPREGGITPAQQDDLVSPFRIR